MLLATEKDYQNGSIYTQYPPPAEVYEKRARLFQYYPEPILVVGCGFGGLVKAFQEMGKVACGVDASRDYAIPNQLTENVYYGNILDLSDWTLGTFETLFTEDMLPCLTDEEAKIAARNCRALSPIVIHMVTERGEDKELNYHTTGYWMTLTGQPTISLEGM